MTDSPDISAKAALRQKVLARRATISAADAVRHAEAAATHFLDAVPVAPSFVVSGFWPIRDELDPRPLMASLARLGCSLCLPVVHGPGRPLTFRAYTDGDNLESAGFGTFVPAAKAPECVPQVMIVPLAGFDSRGHRIGYGRGYYDCTIAALPERPLLVGFAYSVQEVERVPDEAHDERLDMIVTEKGVRRFDMSGAPA